MALYRALGVELGVERCGVPGAQARQPVDHRWLLLCMGEKGNAILGQFWTNPELLIYDIKVAAKWTEINLKVICVRPGERSLRYEEEKTSPSWILYDGLYAFCTYSTFRSRSAEYRPLHRVTPQNVTSYL